MSVTPTHTVTNEVTSKPIAMADPAIQRAIADAYYGFNGKAVAITEVGGCTQDAAAKLALKLGYPQYLAYYGDSLRQMGVSNSAEGAPVGFTFNAIGPAATKAPTRIG